METLILKITLSSCLLIGFYYLFLEKERIFKFNRIYLLVALLFAYVIPFIPFDSTFIAKGQSNLIIGEPVQDFQQINIIKDAGIDWIKFLLVFYVAVSIFFLIKFIYSIVKIKFLKGEKRNYRNQNILIIDKNYAPFSFLDTIYFSRKHLVNDQIDERIFLHEKCHIVERHSADILFLEFLKIFSWFNPALFFFKKAMITNHEFLADEYVLQNNYDISNYQHLILNEIKISQSSNLTHQFDFNNTKKRFIMMTSKNSRFTWLKKFTLLPVLAILFVLFTKKANAQTETSAIAEPTPLQNEQQDIAMPIVETNATAAEKEFIEVSKKIREEFELKKDTIKKKQDVATPVPPSQAKFTGILPQFPDGINAFRTLIQTNFDTSVVKDQKGVIKTVIYTKIDENGRMTDVLAEGPNETFNKEAERVVKLISIDHVWKPATEDGQPVNYRFTLPLTMQFQ
ncbi:hypothetical protein Q73A0000_11845 [Kaistella flava (ex Peng et al. 2021)]|uniref:Peptidase M56 domain-containing protein n=1 Tax=Kaistella flava (ex Peng et al. 2021) TaxID=2038776 RepID=A0A7M2YA14_9FLAO|nr:M56 family metallopeptidase [Kaistella flava (ex Peng et al. 2021)]QOW11001.1 hypothetical protein Q73A0000_11845 [Kaistella flava (ex Peng et al. 2021)]